MRVVTTALERDLHGFVRDWLDGRKFWPAGTEWWYYTEGYELPEQEDEAERPIVRHDVDDIPGLAAWKGKHKDRPFTDWRWDVVRWSNKVFTPIHALYDYTGIGVWMGADCITYRQVPEGMIEAAVKDDYCAFYQRDHLPPECDFWVMNCAHPQHKAFLDFMRVFYFMDTVLTLPRNDDCVVWGEALRKFTAEGRITVNNLSGKYSGHPHPQAASEFGKYIDHRKGERKKGRFSPENKYHRDFLAAQ